MNGETHTNDHGHLPAHLIAHINVKLALIGSQPVPMKGDKEFAEIAAAMAGQSREKDRLLGHYLSPADQRIQTFLYDYLQDVPVTKLPTRTFTLDRPGLARVLSLPLDRDEFSSDIIILFASNRAFCTIRAATGARRREFSTSPKADCRFPTTSSACRKLRSPKCSRSRSIRRAT